MKTPKSMNSITIGITDCARYANYERWFLDAPVKADLIRLSYNLNNLDDIDKCQGIVLSGGEDVDPRRYKRPDLLGRLELTDIDLKRDEFEWDVIERALKLQLPILGICRGMQLFNVYQGGTLIFDIPTVTNIIGHAKFQGMDQRHEIFVEEKTLLNEITGCVQGAVNSSHHQCVEKLGENLLVAARAEDPIIEAMQWQNAHEKPFYLGVQWHPERMVDQNSPFSYNIRQAFLDYIITHVEKSDNEVVENLE
jgi:putative glutamine amidotransferase